MKKVEGWMTSDKEFFTDFVRAKEHEVEARQREGLRRLFKSRFPESWTNEKSLKAIIDFFMENKSEIYDLVDDEYVLMNLEEELS